MNLSELRENLERIQGACGTRSEFQLFQIGWLPEHPIQRFDVTFYEREPLFEVTFDPDLARRWQEGHSKSLINNIAFSDGTIAPLAAIWTLNPMPDDLDVTGADLAAGDQVGGTNGETVRQMIRETYHSKSRAEEDWFLARWTAS